MTLRIELPSDVEAKLRQQAAAAGKDPTIFAREALEEMLASAPSSAVQPAEVPADRRAAEWLAWTSSHRPLGYIADDSRESIYLGLLLSGSIC
jgi:hypothetical protein